jgi:hypothetical protein
MNKKKKLGLIAFAACLAIAVLCLNAPVPFQPARGISMPAPTSSTPIPTKMRRLS